MNSAHHSRDPESKADSRGNGSDYPYSETATAGHAHGEADPEVGDQI